MGVSRMPNGLGEQQRRAYLQALGIDVWVDRSVEAEAHAGAEARASASAKAEAEARAEAETKAPVAPAAAPAAGDDEKWTHLRATVSRCTRCRLHEGRTQTVFGVGAERARIMVIGEAPGLEEDRRGEPFVGRAGKLLDAMLLAIGLSRKQVFITNILKCRPPQNRDPRDDEAESCRGYLEAQIRLIQPRVILAVGRIAARHLLGLEETLGAMRRREHRLADPDIPVVVTYHPAYLLRTPAQKAKAWEDLCRLRQIAGDTA
jgi:DNA polymerase